ncbi:MAG TPA: APC family permease [Anaerolineaceae bacterium]|nr:APC family permease [Anaerolineaceae bacterium]HPN50619.1 APC family permease [Anaerolineaceae bacterium]
MNHQDYEEENSGTAIQHRTADHAPERNWQTILIGKPLPTASAPHQTINKVVGLAVFSSDAISSTAYATQEMLAVLAAAVTFAGMGVFQYAIPITLAIVALLAILILSYEQTIKMYPDGGGAYIVARDNLGEIPAQVAAASLLMDYILTVAVSISSGVAQIVSAYPEYYRWRVEIAIVLVVFIMIINLRGVKEAGVVFAIPTYIFMIIMYLTVGVGFFRLFTGTLGPVVNPPELESVLAAQGVTLFLILRSFASGTTALTGVEAISNGIKAFKEPRSKNAGITLIWMAVILGSLLLGITYLAVHVGTVPSEYETVISQLARTVFGDRNFLYIAVISGTTIILVMAANTAFNGFPLLSALTANDGFLPRQLAYRGSRLVFSRGIITLSIIASILIVVFQASVTNLIPLYAIGVFLSFTLSQFGMARRWWKVGHLKPGEEVKERGSTLRYEAGWKVKMVINAFGALCTLVVAFVFGITKFTDGAWVVIILIPILVVIFYNIHRHYRSLAKKLSLEKVSPAPTIARHRVILPIGGVHQGTLMALRYARKLSDDITAVHVMVEPDDLPKLQEKWEKWGEGVRLVILESPYRELMDPLLDYIEDIDRQRRPNEVITIVVPQFVPAQRWNHVLHSQTAAALQNALMYKKDIVITSVPYQVE